MKNYESLNEALDDLRKRGYEADFTTQSVCLYCGDLDIRLDPDDFHIDETYRFESSITPDDNAMVYAISSTAGVRGTLIDAYGAYCANVSVDLAKKLQSHFNPA